MAHCLSRISTWAIRGEVCEPWNSGSEGGQGKAWRYNLKHFYIYVLMKHKQYSFVSTGSASEKWTIWTHYHNKQQHTNEFWIRNGMFPLLCNYVSFPSEQTAREGYELVQDPRHPRHPRCLTQTSVHLPSRCPYSFESLNHNLSVTHR